MNDFDAYGYRPLKHPWKLLSPYEFLQQWDCEPLLTATHYLNLGEPVRTAWTSKGEDLIRSQNYKNGEVAAKPGEHYIAVTPDTDKSFLFPEDVGPFRHSWALVRKNRPHVVVIEGLYLPHMNKSSTYNAQYCSLFFRPWTLFEGDTIVLHMSLL